MARWRLVAALALGLSNLLTGRATQAVGLVYVDANEVASGGTINLTPASAIESNPPISGTDNKWGFRPLGAGAVVFESGVGAEDSPELTQTLSGLAPSTSYDVYAAYWTDADENWTIRAGTTPGNLTTYNFTGNFGDAPTATATPGVTAAAAVWMQPPSANLSGAVFTEGPAGDLTDRSLLLAKAGTASSDASGNLSVYIDDLPSGGSTARRSWFDGVAYVPAGGSPIALTATLSSTTGAITLTNPTATPFQIKGYSIVSSSGALDATQWAKVTGNLDGAGNDSFDTDNWEVTDPATPGTTFTSLLAEREINQSNGGTLAANGGTLNFGNVWLKTRFQDVQLNLTLADGTFVTMAPSYNGTPIAASDFNANGSLELADYQILVNNMHSNLTTTTRAAAHRSGDYNGDRLVNFTDFQLFRTAYQDAFGQAAFAQLISQVPEPSAIAMIVMAGAATLRFTRRRAMVAALAAVLGVGLISASHAQAILAVDVDDREDDLLSNPGTNTVAGYQSFKLTGTTAAVPSTTRTLGAFDVTFTAVNASGTPQGGIDDRDRATPASTPSLAQLYDDLLFTATLVGPGGGLNLAITNGGVLQPNKDYLFSLYAFDSGSINAPQPRTATWLDGNNADQLVTNTSFNGNVLPTTNDQYKFSGVARTDANGALLLKGRNTTPLSGTTVNIGVIVNGFEVSPFVELTLEVNTTTGGTRFLNEQASSFDMNYYEIRSTAGSLNLGGWNSLDDQDPSEGAGVGLGWEEAANSTANLLSELRLDGMSSFAPGASAAIGTPFTTSGTQDVQFWYAPPDGNLRRGIVKYVSGVSIPGDFDGNHVVNSADLAQWRGDFGINNESNADGDGDSDGNDFLIWQRNLGMSGATESLAAVPEPGSLGLVAGAVGLALAGFRRNPR